jgi:phosphatidylserine/phosphatidylglycerophosphate/cardiolipin synthase-like enzyme
MLHIHNLKSLAYPRVALWLLLLSFISSFPLLADQIKANQTYKGAATGTIYVAFSPNGGATELVTDTIHQAKKQILVQAYSFTSPTISKALADAKARGIDVKAVLDKSQWTERYSGATYLMNHRIPVLIDDKHAIAHNKVMIIDDNTIITGSFNFTKAAEEKNAENVIVLQDNPALAQGYAQNWRAHAEHSVAYTGPHGRQADRRVSKPQPGNAGFACGNKTKCSQMNSCEEARFYLTRCSVRSLDKDGNGVPCEALCK